ncbi:Hsp33 family molecular chaperone HslO [Thermosipho atlanticus]|uniref:33 kDa chaperonin n=1 Tax=Thermosipho atlanticus DSM 15807 TaxID=1123380 RepID=A0A1M5RS65_9BACT|nr:Hsp33 family molecular chaperone HslO [Thermosipho atlanticus]SHH29127.1 molecular chaperone Hsp33 [Thermosipho atlanticus DSM 15807]
MLKHGIAYNALVRFSVIDSTQLVAFAQKKHELSPLPAVALGRLLTGVSLMIPWLSEKERLTYIIEGRGALKSIVAQAKHNGNIRGYISPTILDYQLNKEGKFDLKSAIGGGTLKVVRDLGLKHPYVTPIPLISGEIAEDLAYYFTVSEQIPSAIALGVLIDKNGIKKAGGIIIQILDKSLDKKIIEKIEKKFKEITPISDFLSNHSPLDVITYIFGDAIEQILEKEVKFKCDCSKEIAYESLKVLTKEDLNFLLNKEKTEVVCKWCNTKYYFTKKEIEKIKLEKLGD